MVFPNIQYSIGTGSRDRSLGSLLLTETGCHVRCFKDVSTTGTGSVDAEAV